MRTAIVYPMNDRTYWLIVGGFFLAMGFLLVAPVSAGKFTCTQDAKDPTISVCDLPDSENLATIPDISSTVVKNDATLTDYLDKIISILTSTQQISDTVAKTSDIVEKTSDSLIVHGTPYGLNDSAKIFVQVFSSGIPQDKAACDATVYNPDNTKFLDRANLFPLGENGIYFRNTTPLTKLGIYMVSAFCQFPSRNDVILASNFSTDGTTTGGDLTFTYVEDTNSHVITEATANNRINVSYWLKLPADVIDGNVTRMIIQNTITTFVLNQNFTPYIFNYSGNRFEALNSTSTFANGYNSIVNIWQNKNMSNYISPDGYIRINETVNTAAGNALYNDYIAITLTSNQTLYPSSVFGSSEFSVTNLSTATVLTDVTNRLDSLDTANKNNFTNTNSLIATVQSTLTTIQTTLTGIINQLNSLDLALLGNTTYTNSNLQNNFTATNNLIANINTTVGNLSVTVPPTNVNGIADAVIAKLQALGIINPFQEVRGSETR